MTPMHANENGTNNRECCSGAIDVSHLRPAAAGSAIDWYNVGFDSAFYGLREADVPPQLTNAQRVSWFDGHRKAAILIQGMKRR